MNLAKEESRLTDSTREKGGKERERGAERRKTIKTQLLDVSRSYRSGCREWKGDTKRKTEIYSRLRRRTFLVLFLSLLPLTFPLSNPLSYLSPSPFFILHLPQCLSLLFILSLTYNFRKSLDSEGERGERERKCFKEPCAFSSIFAWLPGAHKREKSINSCLLEARFSSHARARGLG